MKRILSVVMCLALLLSVFPLAASVSAAKEYTSGNYTYTVKDGKATIVDHYTGNRKVLAIPDKMGKYPVVAIGSNAFAGDKSLQIIELPDTVQEIGYQAFNGCKNLKTISLPKNLKKIGSCAFSYCTSLRSITIPQKVTMLKPDAFDYCESLKEIKVHKANTMFCSVDGVLYNKAKTILLRYPADKANTTYSVLDSVKTIGEHAFFVAYNLERIHLPDNLLTIEKAAFYGCKNLRSITIPSKVKTIGVSAFAFCYDLTKMVIPDNVQHLDEHTFAYCTKLEDVTLGKQINQISRDMFFECSSLKTLKIRGSIEGAYAYAFYGCNKLSDVYFCGEKADKDKINFGISDVFKNAKWHYVKPVTLKISSQPKLVTYAKNGATAKVSVKAAGNNLTYTWYVKNNGETKYTKSSITKPTYSVTMTDKVKNRRLYCVVKDLWGNTVQTKTVVLRMSATVTSQPKTATVAKNKIARITVKAKGDGLKYTWYIKNAGQSKFTKTSATSATYSCKMTTKSNGRYVYCVVKDKYGNKVQSKTVRLKMK